MNYEFTDEAIPPGDHLSDELHARKITQKELASRMGRPVKVVSEIIHGKKAITAETALQLAGALEGIHAITWLRLEASYRLALARKKHLDSHSKRATWTDTATETGKR